MQTNTVDAAIARGSFRVRERRSAKVPQRVFEVQRGGSPMKLRRRRKRMRREENTFFWTFVLAQ